MPVKKTGWLIFAGLLAAVVLIAAAAAPWAYKTYVAGPPEPALALPADARPAATGVDGTWTVQPGSQAGYRVQQQLLWEMVDVNGRTDGVTGTIEITESHVRSVAFTVDVAAMESGRPGRDERFRSSDALETAAFPTAELTSNVPVDLSGIPDDGTSTQLEIPVQLTLRGITRPATARVDIQRNGDRVDVAGTIPVRLFDFHIAPPKPFASILQVQPVATIEFLVHLAKG